MKLKRFTYLICAILVATLSLFPSTSVSANIKFPETFTADWYAELGTCNDGSIIVDSEVLIYNRTYYVDDNDELVKIIDHISGDVTIYVKGRPDLSLTGDPIRGNATIYFTPEIIILQRGFQYKFTLLGLGNIFHYTGRIIYKWDEDLGWWVPEVMRGNYTPTPDVINWFCTYFGLQ